MKDPFNSRWSIVSGIEKCIFVLLRFLSLSIKNNKCQIEVFKHFWQSRKQISNETSNLNSDKSDLVFYILLLRVLLTFGRCQSKDKWRQIEKFSKMTFIKTSCQQDFTFKEPKSKFRKKVLTIQNELAFSW